MESLYRPGNWLNKMVLISKAIPNNITLNKLSAHSNANSKKKENIKLNGIIVIDKQLNGLKQLNSFKNNLESNTSLMKDFTKIEINENEISMKDKKTIMSFNIGIF